QPNLPGTVDTHPNWQQRLQGDSARLLEQPLIRQRLARLDQARSSAAGPVETSASSINIDRGTSPDGNTP
ncbi:MAG: hypothetical protein EOO54_18140, partial [Haliea sp.]